MNYTIIQETEFYQGKCTLIYKKQTIFHEFHFFIFNLWLCHTSQQYTVFSLCQHGEIEAQFLCKIGKGKLLHLTYIKIISRLRIAINKTAVCSSLHEDSIEFPISQTYNHNVPCTHNKNSVLSNSSWIPLRPFSSNRFSSSQFRRCRTSWWKITRRPRFASFSSCWLAGFRICIRLFPLSE